MMYNKNKSVMTIIILIIIILVGSVYYIVQTDRANTDTVEIMQDNNVLYTIDLSEIKDKELLTVDYHGHKNTLELTPHKIRVIEADCTDKICIQMGYLQSMQQPIVCLPNHLTIRYVENKNLFKTEKLDSAVR